MSGDLKEITRRALAGDAEAVRELRRKGLLKDKPTEGRYPASNAQKSLWLWQEHNPGSRAYAMPAFIPLSGSVPVEACEHAVNAVVRRHESLRTVFEAREGMLYQRVRLPGPVRLAVEDLRACPHPRQAMLDTVKADLDQPFDPGTGPLIRFRLFLTPEARPVLFVNAHHIIVDGFSQAVLAREIRALCEGFATGNRDPLPPVPLQIKDHAAWQSRMLESGRGRAMLHWWRTQLAGVEPLDLPLDFPRPKTGTCTGKTIAFTLDREADAALRGFTREAGCTSFNALAFCTAALLARYTGSRDMVIGMPCACRTHKETESLIGFLANPVALRFAVDPGKTFLENLTAARATLVETMERQEYPFESLLEKLSAPRHPGRNPLFDVVVAAAHDTGEARDGFLPDAAELPLRHAKFDMLVTFEDSRQGTKATIEYNSELFLPGRIERMAGHLSRLLKSAWASPGTALGALDILSREERRQVTAGFNATARPYPAKSVAELFEEAARRFPDSIAVKEAGKEPATYAEIDRRAEAVADSLCNGLHIRPGSFVGVVPGPTSDMIVAVIGILKAQCAYMPMDPSLPSARMALLAKQAGCPLILAAEDAGKKSIGSAVPEIPVHTPGELPSAPRRTARYTSPDAPCYLMFTSGSTGAPKGVSIPHKAVARLVLNTDFIRFTPEDRILQTAPLAFDGSTLEIWGPLLAGGRIILTGKEAILQPGGLAGLIAEHGATVLFLTTGLCHRVAEDAPETFRPLRVLVTGGDVAIPHLMRRILESCPGLDLINGYGPTENTTFTACHRITREDTDGPIPIGRPIANTRVHILDDSGLPAPMGVWGEIHAAGDGLALEYLGRPDLTEQAFIHVPALPGERLYRTGDMGRWRHDGILEFMGRRDTQVKIRGFRIEMEEIENTLLGAPGVRQAAVVVLDRGGDKELCAFVVADSGEPGQWRTYLEGLLPSYMVPARFTALAQIPLTSSGKTDRRALIAMAPENLSAPTHGAPPRGEVEQAVSAIFQEILGRPIGRSDDFFHHGGHSLKAMQVVSRLEKRFKVSLSLRSFFAAPTVEAAARRVMDASGKLLPEIPRAPEADHYPVSHAQRRMWILSRMEGGNRAYNVTGALKVEGDLAVDVLESVLHKLSRRHEILRTTFALTDGEIRQIVHTNLPPAIEHMDLSGEADPMDRAFQLARENAGRVFDLEQGPLWRLLHMRTGPTDHVLLFSMHHIVSDGWSVDILVREMDALYAALAKGREADLPPLAIQYRDFAVWQTERKGSDDGGHMAWWLSRLAHTPPPRDLPADRLRPRTQSFNGAALQFTLPVDVEDRLKGIAEGGHGVFALLTALVKSLLHRYTGVEDILVGCPVAGREHGCLEDQVGLYMNTVVLRDTVQPHMPFMELARNVGSTIADALHHQGCPFDLLVERLAVVRDVSRPPLFNVMVSFQNPDRKLPSFSGLKAHALHIPTGTSHFDLTFDFQKMDDGLNVILEYNTDLFDGSRMERLRDHFLTLAESAAASPQTPVSRLGLLPGEELKQVLAWGNEVAGPSGQEPAREAPEDPVARFEGLAAADPGAPALVYGETRLRRGEVNRLANGLARLLLDRGLRPEEPVALLLPRSERGVWAALGVAKAGGAFVFLDPGHPEERIAQILREADIRLAVIQAMAPNSPILPLAGVECIDIETARHLRCANPDIPCRPVDLAYIVFTSGSTGTPKGVLVERGAVANLMIQADSCMYEGLGPKLREAMTSAFIFDVAVQQIFACLSRGHELHVLPEDARHDPSRFLGYLREEAMDIADTTPGFLAEILEETGAGGLPRSLKRLTVGNEALPWSVVEAFFASPARCSVSLVNVYGPTECCVNATAEPLHPGSTAPGLTAPIGRPLPGVRALVLDQGGKPSPISVPGEIVLSGAGLARGYLNRQDLTRDRFTAHPFRPGERVYRTGDMGRFLEDGRIEFLGRIDDQLKVRGFRIEAGEIEHRLRQHPALRAAAVGAVPVRGSAPDLVAWVEPAAGAHPFPPGDLREHLAKALPGYMLPAFVIPVPKLPLLPGGKPDKHALARDYPPGDAEPPPGAASVRLPSQAEAELLQVWRSVLESRTVGPDVSFFEAGGNSLRIIRLHRELEKRFPGTFTVTDLFSLPTAADQARHLDARRTTAENSWPETPTVAEGRQTDEASAQLRNSPPEGGYVLIPPLRGGRGGVNDARACDNARHPPAPLKGGINKVSGKATKKKQVFAGFEYPASSFTVQGGNLPRESVAIIGMAVRLADYDDLDGLWTDLVHGVDRIRPFPEQRRKDALELLDTLGWEHGDAAFRDMAFLDRVDLFDAGFFRLSPADASLLAPVQRLFIETAQAAVEEAGYGGPRLKGAKVGVFAGGSGADPEFVTAAHLALPHAAEQIFAGNTPSNMITRLAYLMDWHGPAMLVDTACSSGLAALHVACRSLLEGECDLALAGAAKTVLLPMHRGRLPVESADGRTRAFSDGSDGTGGGEGCVMVLLKPLPRAMADGDRILAVIRGSAMNQDGASAGLTVPNARAQAVLIREAWENAGLDPSSMGYLEAHGTGTALGDPIEVDGITKAVRPFSSRRQFIPVGSVKTNFGHLDNAAGMLGLAKAVLSMAKEAIPASLHFETPNRNIRFEESPLYVCDRLIPWPRSAKPRRCGVSSFGLSGINCHVVIEESPGAGMGDQTGPHLLPLAAPNDDGLARLARNYLYRLAMDPELARRPGDLCFTASVGRGHEGRRMALVFDSVAELQDILEAVAEKGPHHAPERGIFHGAATDRPGSPASLAEQYVRGLHIDWEAVHRSSARRPVSLPGSIMNRRRLWPRFRAEEHGRRELRDGTARSLPGPLLETLLAETPEGSVYKPHLAPEQCWPLGEHRVAGVSVLVGTAYLQMAYEASLGHAIGLPLEVRDLFLGRPLAPNPDTSVAIEVSGREEAITMRVSSREGSGAWSRHAEARLVRAASPPPRIDRESIQARLHEGSEPAPRPPGEDGPVQVGERWRCVRRVWSGKEEVLGLLSLPAAFIGDLDAYAFHPALLDAALHLGLPLCDDNGSLMPMSMARAVLFSPIPARVFSHARLLPGSSAASARFDVTLFDHEGTVVADIQGYTLARYKAPARRPRLLALRWAPVPPEAPADDGPGRVALVLADGQQETLLARSLLESLSGPGAPDFAGSIILGKDPAEARAEDMAREIHRMGADGIVFLSPALDAEPAEDLPELELRLRLGIEACFLLVKALVNHAGATRRTLLLVGRGAFAAGDARVTRPENAALAALARTISQEYEHLRCRYVDMDGETEASALLRELSAASVEAPYPIALRGSARLAEQAANAEDEKPAGKLPLRDGDVVLVSGGLGGMGLALSRRLAGLARLKIALVGRSPLPDRETWDAIPAEGTDPLLIRCMEGVRALEAAGSEVMVLTADVSEPGSLAKALQAVRRRWGGIAGVVHCAGVAGDGFLFRKDLHELRRVMRPKIQGTWLLDHETRGDEPRLFFLCSSLTGVTGGPGQGDYAAANAFQDAWAQARADLGLPALSLAWCAWSETGMAFDRGVADPGRSLTTAEALDVFDRALTRSEPRLLVEEPGLEIRDTPSGGGLTETAGISPRRGAVGVGPSRPPLSSASAPHLVLTGRPEGGYSGTEQAVAAIWAKVLGHEALNVADDFFRLGGDSINAMGIRNEAVETFGLDISIADLFANPTIEGYAALIESRRTAMNGGTGDSPPRSPIRPAPDRPLYPLSIPQRWMARLWQDAPDSRGWNLPEAWEIQGTLDPRRLESALGRFLQRHEALRARFHMEGESVFQAFEPWDDFRLPVHTVLPHEVEEHARRFVRPFHIFQDRLFRAELLRIASDRHVLCLDMHHAAADGLSLDILGRELSSLYQGPALPPLPVRYRDYAVWQDDRRTRGELDSHLSYWTSRFQDGVPLLHLPTDFKRPERRLGNGGICRVVISGPLLEGAKRLAHENGGTLFAVFLASVFALLRRLTGQEDMVVEISDFGRTIPEIQGGFGMFVGALPLRSRVVGGSRATRLLEDIRSGLMEAMEHREVPVYLLADRLQPAIPAGRSRLADVAVSYMNFGEPAQTEDPATGWRVQPLQTNLRRSSVADLKFFVTEGKEALHVLMEYDADLFKPATAAGFTDLLLAVMEQMTANPETAVRALGGSP